MGFNKINMVELMGDEFSNKTVPELINIAESFKTEIRKYKGEADRYKREYVQLRQEINDLKEKNNRLSAENNKLNNLIHSARSRKLTIYEILKRKMSI